MDKACKTPIEELRKKALKHYEEAAMAIHHWNSFVSDAIKAYKASPPSDSTAVNEAILLLERVLYGNCNIGGIEADIIKFLKSRGEV